MYLHVFTCIYIIINQALLEEALLAIDQSLESSENTLLEEKVSNYHIRSISQ